MTVWAGDTAMAFGGRKLLWGATMAFRRRQREIRLGDHGILQTTGDSLRRPRKQTTVISAPESQAQSSSNAAVQSPNGKDKVPLVGDQGWLRLYRRA